MGQTVRRVLVCNLAPRGMSCPILTGIGQFAANRRDWSVRWELLPPGSIQCLLDWKPDGIICISDEHHRSLPSGFSDIPCVMAGAVAGPSKASSVWCDPRKIGQVAAEYLLRRGHRRLACLALDDAPAHSQLQGFVESARQHQIEPHCKVLSGSGTEPNPDLFSNRATVEWLKKLPRPTGMFVVCGRLAANLCELVRKLGMAVPDDLAIVASGNDLAAALVSRPPLSTVEIPLEQIGFQAATQLANCLAGAPHRQIVLPPRQVVARRSAEAWAVDDLQIRQVLEFIYENAHRPIGMRDILSVVAASRRSLEQRFRSLLNRTVAEEIRRAHVQLALRRLNESDASLAVISRSCGLTSSTQLGALVRRYTGLTPLEIRRRAQAAVLGQSPVNQLTDQGWSNVTRSGSKVRL